MNKNTKEIFEFSKEQARVSRLRRRVSAWSVPMDQYFQKVGRDCRLVMVTLTYREGDGWKKNHIRDYLLSLRSRLEKKLLGYAWVAELQERGAVHYHVLLLVKRGADIPKPDESGMWSHGSSRIETAKKIFYILKYTQKHKHMGKDFPKGLRLFAVWIAPSVISDLQRFHFRVSSLPKWLAEKVFQSLADGLGLFFPKKQKGGGWWCFGRFVTSPYIVLAF